LFFDNKRKICLGCFTNDKPNGIVKNILEDKSIQILEIKDQKENTFLYSGQDMSAIEDLSLPSPDEFGHLDRKFSGFYTENFIFTNWGKYTFTHNSETYKIEGFFKDGELNGAGHIQVSDGTK
jgi:hypothetical protein